MEAEGEVRESGSPIRGKYQEELSGLESRRERGELGERFPSFVESGYLASPGIVDNRYGIRVDENGFVVSDYLIDDGKEWRYFGDETKGSPRGYSIDPSMHYDAGAEFGSPQGTRGKRIPITRGKLNRILRRNRVGDSDRKEITSRSVLRKLMVYLDLYNYRDVEMIAYKIVKLFYDTKMYRKESVTFKESLVLSLVALQEAIHVNSIALPRNMLYNAFLQIPQVSDNVSVEEVKKLEWKIKKFLSENNITRLIRSQRTVIRTKRNRTDTMLKRVDSFIRLITSDLAQKGIIMERDKTLIATRSSQLLRILVNVFHKSLAGKKPEAIAAAMVYMVARLHNYEVKQSDVARSVSLKENNVRKAFRFLLSGQQYIVLLTPA